ncbi:MULTISPECIES: CAP family protein [Rhodomicrobium]|uniref:CAP family protein n=1 Tax=Rhodomicrobium TaxID=1068 RepID=UPI000B4BEC1C|nr:MULTISPECIES: CAP family protein [Rhodomicrobium]
MIFGRFWLTALAAALSLPLLLSPASAETVTPAEQTAILSLHNSYRAQHCVPALTWSAELAAAAQRWAEKCWIAHDKSRGHIGENIAWGGDRTASSAVDAWYKEVDVYDYGKPGFAASTAHFTQMVWKETKQIGCGVAQCYFGAIRLWVCRYGPTGNWAGKYPQNVPKRCK